MSKNRIAELRSRKGWSQEELAQRVGTTNQQIGRLEGGQRRLTVDWMDRIAGALGVTVNELLAKHGQTVAPLVGYVGAGSQAHYYGNGDSPNDFVPMPPGGTPETVAVEIRGDSLGSLFNRWLVYYDDVHTPPTENLLRKLCVVGLADGRVLVKQLVRGSKPGLWHLVSQTEGIIEDAVVTWAAEVRALTPR